MAATRVHLDELLAATPTGCWIGGRFLDARGGGRFLVEDPATGTTLAAVADAGPEDGAAALEAAQKSAAAFSQSPPRTRAELLRAAYSAMIDQRERLAALVAAENGKTLADARAEITYAAEFFRWFAEEAVRVEGRVLRAPSGANEILVLRQPIGIALAVTPWNFPAAMLTRKLGPALAAGCPMICKPAEDTPLTALAIAKLLDEVGVPKGVVSILPSSRPGPLVNALLGDTRVRKLSFTGSTEVGRALLARASEHVVSCSMELGGNAPFLVFADADLDAALEGAMVAKLRNGGEACTAANRFLVEQPVVKAFASRLAQAMGALRLGPGLEPTSDLGPLVNATERDRVASLVERSIAGGSRALVGGRVPAGPGCFYPPTVLVDVAGDAEILAQEIFGPVAPIVAFTSEDEAVELANATQAGLVAYCYTGDLARGLRVAERLEAGMVGLNRGLVSDPAAPFGGVKESGLGREGGHEGIEEYLETKYVALSW